MVEYNPDTQYSAGLILCDLLIPIWPNLPTSDRRAMLTNLMRTMRKQTYPNELAGHIGEGELHNFCASIVRARTDKRRFQIIAKTAKAPILKEQKSLETASAPGLWLTDAKGIDYRVQIFRLLNSPVDGAVCVQYIDSPTTWEGTVTGKPFQLTMDVDDGELFNGLNGTLRCDDGIEIPCFF